MDLLWKMQRVLAAEAAAERFCNSSEEIYKKHLVLEGPPKEIAERRRDAWSIAGGIKDQARHATNARLVRDDGAWLHFTVTVAERDRALDVIAYDFELVFEQTEKARFVRIDLNPSWHANTDRGMGCHLHPGHDDVQIQWQKAPPLDVLRFLVNLRCIR